MRELDIARASDDEIRFFGKVVRIDAIESWHIKKGRFGDYFGLLLLLSGFISAGAVHEVYGKSEVGYFLTFLVSFPLFGLGLEMSSGRYFVVRTKSGAKMKSPKLTTEMSEIAQNLFRSALA